MKNKIKTMGIITLAAVVVLVMTACDELLGNDFDPPTDVTVTLLSNSNVHITWDAVKGADGYTIAYRTDLDSSSTRRDAGSSTITTYTHNYYESRDVTTLYYYVKAHNRNYSSEERYKESGYSAPVSVTITD